MDLISNQTNHCSSNSKTINHFYTHLPSLKMMRKLIAFIPLFSSFPILLFITIPLLQLCPTTSSAASATAISGRKSNETDHQALLQFKSKITNDPFAVFTSWNTSIHFCQWHGVRCSRRHQRVTRLGLRSSKLAGTISPHVGNLSFLRVLDLQNNSFSREIPPEIGHLHRLEYLLLNNNTISGQIPSNISSFSNLIDLDLSSNQLVGYIPQELGSLSKLEFVSLWNNNLTESIPHSLGNLSYLVTLDLGQNLLVGSIPDSLGQLSSIHFLYLPLNRLSGTIPASIFNLSYITELDLGGNDLSGNLSPDLFISLPNIIYFSIAFNRISGPIPTSLSNSSNMAILQLQSNQLTGGVPFLHKVQKLQDFSISSNNLGSREANDLSFLASFSNATILERLDISNNSLGGVLPQQIGNFSTMLKWFHMWINQIQGSIPFEIGNLINLEIIHVAENQLSGIIPSTIGKLQKLKLLYLNDNMFSGSIPPFFGNITQLIDLRINRNDLSGSIPSSLGTCQNLLVLDLSHNNLTGTIPSQVIGLPSLSKMLDLSDNRLSGVIPLEIGNMKNAGYLNLSSNMLSGMIPSTLTSCISLQVLDLDNNLFEGSIPSSLSSLRALDYLDLSRNKLSGEIPDFLPHLNALQYLNLSFNNLEGSLPIGGIFQNASATSIAGNSKLCGGIPEFQLPICSSNRPNKKGLGTRIKLIISIVAGILGLISVLFSLWLLKRRKAPVLNNQANTIMQLSYHNLYEATEGFSSANLIGEGSFGSVYKGTIETGRTLVAVKVLNLMRFGAFKSFKAECEALKNIRHRNLVRVITVCSSIDSQGNDFKALVYEFMVNGSLEEWVHHLVRANLLQRLHIAIDVACALDYLHHQNETPIVHCDLKPSNILLDGEMTAHVGDFGLARFLLGETNESNGNQSSSMGVRGTVGYAPPEYGMGNEVAICGDVYSYGILLLEMFTGKRPVDDMFTDGLNLHNFVQSFLPEQVTRILDPVLHQEIEETSTNMVGNQRSTTSSTQRIEELLIPIFKIGVACSVETPGERMRMDEVAAQLISIRAKLLGTRRTGDRT